MLTIVSRWLQLTKISKFGLSSKQISLSNCNFRNEFMSYIVLHSFWYCEIICMHFSKISTINAEMSQCKVQHALNHRITGSIVRLVSFNLYCLSASSPVYTWPLWGAIDRLRRLFLVRVHGFPADSKVHCCTCFYSITSCLLRTPQ